MADTLTAEHFLPHVEKVFRVKGGRHAFTLAQVEVSGEKGGSRQSFNLIFSGPPGDVLPEGLYTLEVAEGPQFELYVIPIHTPERGTENYQSAFN
jgi:hypothetical protein